MNAKQDAIALYGSLRSLQDRAQNAVQEGGRTELYPVVASLYMSQAVLLVGLAIVEALEALRGRS